MLLLLAGLVLRPNRLLDRGFEEWRKTPQMRIEDAYKWLFQATMGGEHAVKDRAEAKSWLWSEWRTLTRPLPHEPLMVPLDPERGLVRLNLRPYRAAGGSRRLALSAFLESSKQFRPKVKAFRREWEALGERLSERPQGPLDFPGWKRLDRATRPHGFPAIDHSKLYERSYHPAYRVILSRCLHAKR